jgi:glycerophosphoryl diester phosphodiesterase
VGVHHGMATRSLLAIAHGAGKRVHAWTADTPAMMLKTLDVAVDAIVTSYPRRLQAAILARLAKCEKAGV